MRSVELNYFVFTILSMTVLAFVIIFSNFYREKARETSDPQDCNKNNLTQAVRVTEYEPVNNNETNPKNHFDIEGHQYGCPCSRNRCIRKCCPWGQYLVDESCIFQSELEQLQKEMFSELKFYKTIKDDKPFTHNNSQFNIVFKLPDRCPENKMDRVIYWSDKFHLLENGNLWMKHGKYVDRLKYCFDFKDNDTKTIYFFVCYSKMVVKSNSEKDQSHWYIIKGYANVVSSVFFILTFLIYAVLPNLQNLNGKCLMCYFLSMLVGSLTLSTILLVNDKDFRSNCCPYLAFTIQFSFVCSYFWINIVSFDIWLMISGRHTQLSSSRSPKGCCSERLMVYSIYAWGCPVLILAAALTIEYSPGVLRDLYWTSRVNIEKCALGKASALLFQYMPLGVLVSLNTAMFVATVINIRMTLNNKILGTARRNQNFSDQMQRFYLCLKLFLLMGAFWGMDVISYWIDNNGSSWLHFIDCITSLQGLFVFIILVCKRRVMRQLQEKYGGRLFSTFFATSANTDSTKTKECEMRLKSYPLEDKE